jgi:Undecaprenyl-phosphate glucose phosphotransferase
MNRVLTKTDAPARGLAQILHPARGWRSSDTKRLQTIAAQLAAGEFLTVAMVAYLGAALYHQAAVQCWPDPATYIPAVLALASVELSLALAAGHYARMDAQNRELFVLNGVKAVVLAFALFLSSVFLLKVADVYSRGAFFLQLLSTAVAVCALRARMFSRMQALFAAGRIEVRQAVLVGDADRCWRAADRLRSAGIHAVGVVPIPAGNPTTSPAMQAAALREMVRCCRPLQADDILILPGQRDPAIVEKVASSLVELPANIHLLPVDALNPTSTSQIVSYGNLVTIQLSRCPLSGCGRAVKRSFDVAAAAVGLIALAPFLAMVALAIKLESRGPVFFAQRRHGYNNIPIRVLKFRSMTVLEDGGNVFHQVQRHDPRVTKVGRFLRRTSIDELPQLYNVLLGEMSIVGPRPHAIAHNEMFEDVISSFWRRHNVKPGITGWAQVHGCRGETDTIEKMQRRVQFDLYYIDHWSFLLDMKIILMTLFSSATHANAY